MSIQTGGEALVDALIVNGIDTVFGLPGAQLDPIFAALHDRQDDIKIYHSRHEQGCAYMAFGYAEATGKTGTCMVVPGPGLLNAGAAISTGYACNSPMLIVAGQLFTTMIDRGFGSLHEIKDQIGLASHITDWTGQILHPADAAAQVAKALEELHRGRTRPTYLEMPFDTAMQKAKVPTPVPAVLGKGKPLLDERKVKEIASALREAKRPLICIGGGAMDAGPELLALAEKCDAAIAISQNGLGAIDSRNDRVFTQLGCYELWKNADVVVGFGTRFYPAALNYGRRDLDLYKIDIDPSELFRLPPPVKSLLGDAADAAVAITNSIDENVERTQERVDWFNTAKLAVASDLQMVAPQVELLGIIRKRLGETGIFVSDLTQLYFVSQDAYPVYRPRTYIQPSYQGTLGHAAATSLGVKIGKPDCPVICVAGDGGFMFTVQELATAVKYNIAVVFLIMNDNAFGNVKRLLNENYGGRVICAELTNPDFVKLAESFGIEAERVVSPDELDSALERAFAANRPVLLEYQAPEFPSPWPLIHRPPPRA